jgi:hypothetical protein
MNGSNTETFGYTLGIDGYAPRYNRSDVLIIKHDYDFFEGDDILIRFKDGSFVIRVFDSVAWIGSKNGAWIQCHSVKNDDKQVYQYDTSLIENIAYLAGHDNSIDRDYDTMEVLQ